MHLDVWMIFVLQNSLTMAMTYHQSDPHGQLQLSVLLKLKVFFVFLFFFWAKLNKISLIIEISGNTIFHKSPEQDGEFALGAVRTRACASLNQTCGCHSLNK